MDWCAELVPSRGETARAGFSAPFIKVGSTRQRANSRKVASSKRKKHSDPVPAEKSSSASGFAFCSESGNVSGIRHVHPRDHKNSHLLESRLRRAKVAMFAQGRRHPHENSPRIGALAVFGADERVFPA